MERYRFILFLPADRIGSVSPVKGSIIRRASKTAEVDIKFDDLDSGFILASGLGVQEIYLFLTGNKNVEKNEGLGKIDEGFKLMEEEKYWLGHEFFEAFWKGTSGDRSLFFHDVVLVCVSMVHYQMGNIQNAERIFNHSINRLSKFGLKELENVSFSYPIRLEIIHSLERKAKELSGS
ncbi:MAG: DUF309 domain-containing protein [Thermoplasmatales archaeon]